MNRLPPPPPSPQRPRYATFGQRLAAWALDTTALQIGMFAIRILVLAPWITQWTHDAAGVLANASATPEELLTAVVWPLLRLLTVYAALSLVTTVIYHAVQEGSKRSASLGKRVPRLRVVHADTFQQIGPGRAAWRTAAKWLSALPLCVGYLWMLADDRSQTWHDKLASTVVLHDPPVRPVPPPGAPPAPPPPPRAS